MMTRRSTGKTRVARAVWYARKGTVELRAAPLPRPQPGEALVRALFSGISRGTERLVFNGEVGRSEWERMRCPNQEGAFPFPVKYGYCATGIVEVGPGELVGQTVFCLHPHQDHFNAPIASLVPVPDGVPARRATLTANMETALNALWDCRRGPGRSHRRGGRGGGGAAGRRAGGAAAGRGRDERGRGRKPRAYRAVPGRPVCAGPSRRRAMRTSCSTPAPRRPDSTRPSIVRGWRAPSWR